MSVKQNECQICKAPIDMGELRKTFLEGLPYELQPDSKACCSYRCLHQAIQANGAWRLKENIRRIMNADFGTFQSVFGFGEAGDYAKNMYELARMHPVSFMFRLDMDNFVKFVNGRI